MTDVLGHLDFETRSELELGDVGLWRYARHPSTDAWCAAFALGESEDPALWFNGQARTAALLRFLEHVERGGFVAAHSAGFEHSIWNNVMAPKHGWPELKLEQMVCTMVTGYAMGLPGALENVAPALGVRVEKDMEGRAIMLRYARPWRREPTIWLDQCPEFTVGGRKWTGQTGLARLGEYCQQDVRVERAAYARMVPLSAAEREMWLLNERINQQGVRVDVETAKAAVAMAEKVKIALDKEMSKVTGGRVQSCGAIMALKEWMAELGVKKESLAKQEIVDLLPELEESHNPNAQLIAKALRLRQEAGKASTAKFDVIVNQAADDGRLHHMYQWHGANTGRAAGRGVQVHNLPRDVPSPKVVDHVLQLTRAGDFRGIDMLYGPPLTMLSRSLRSFLLPDEGELLLHGDWANVEGRGQAWFANEQWKLDAFRAADNKTGPGIYELAYSRMFGVPVESVKDPSEERQVGKVSELAFGYGGGVGSFHTMGKVYNVKVADSEADEFKHAWRAAHPRITKVWREIETAALNAMRFPGTAYTCGWHGRHATYKMVGSFLWCMLPSGRVICYPSPKILPGPYGDQLTYMKQPDPNKPEKIIADPMNSPKWSRVSTWGGTLFNNIVQGFCSDILRYGLKALADLSARIVIHTHDDINVSVKPEHAEAARAVMLGIMRTPPAWMRDFPLFTKGVSIQERY